MMFWKMSLDPAIRSNSKTFKYKPFFCFSMGINNRLDSIEERLGVIEKQLDIKPAEKPKEDEGAE